MTKNFCDFCGDEIVQPDRRAVLVLIQPAKPRAEANPFEMMFSAHDHEQRQLEMCTGCVGHLTAISARVKEERAKRPKRTPKETIAEGIMLGLQPFRITDE